MKNTARIISTYAADVSGVCSALYELGGMTVMHDPSGCNSTYNTHDEPRWYQNDSLIFISALTEMDAIMGNDEKLIHDVTDAVNELHPRFAALAGTPIPMIIGTDLQAVAAQVERNTGVPAFAVNTNSMHSYLTGAGMALDAIAGRFCDTSLKPEKGSKKVNILGATPLDFSVSGSVESMKAWLRQSGFTVNSVWAMGSSLDELVNAGAAEVNLVVSYAGIPAAKRLEEMFGTPYVVGVPIGEAFAAALAQALAAAIKTGKSAVPYTARAQGKNVTLIGESVYSGSLAAAIEAQYGLSCTVICPLETQDGLMTEFDALAPDEDDIIPLLPADGIIIADPMYRPICPPTARFYDLPHEAFSGRIYRKAIPNLICKI